MNGYNFTQRVRKVLGLSREEAARLHHEYIGTEHVLLAIIREGDGVATTVLQNLGVDLEDMRRTVEETVKKGKAGQTTGPDLPFTSRAKKVLEFAMSEARELNHAYVGTEHLLLGLIREKSGIGAQVLTDAGVTLDAAREETLRILGSGADDTSPSVRRPDDAHEHGHEPAQRPAGDHLMAFRARRQPKDTVDGLPEPSRSIVADAFEIAKRGGRAAPDVADLLQAVVFSSRIVAAAFAAREIEFQGMLMEIRSLLENETDPPPA